MVLLTKFADKYAGKLLCDFLGLFKRKDESKKGIGAIMAVQLWGVGETILTLPAIDALRKKFPNARISVLATSRNKDIFFGNKNIDSLILIKPNIFSVIGLISKNIKKYDLVIDMEEYLNVSAIISFFLGDMVIGYSHGARAKLYDTKIKYNDKQHASQTFMDLVRVLGIEHEFDKLPMLDYSKTDKNFVDNLLKNNAVKGGELTVCVAPGAAESAKSRMWPYEKYAELCDEIVYRHNARIIFVGSLAEFGLIDSIQKRMESKNTINTAGKITLTQLFYLIKKAKIFIGNDAGPMHVAAAQGVRTIGLFGPNLPMRFGPYGAGNVGLYKGYNCEFSPCINVHKGQIPDCLYPKTSNDYQKCMKNISVDDVLKEFEKLV